MVSVLTAPGVERDGVLMVNQNDDKPKWVVYTDPNLNEGELLNFKGNSIMDLSQPPEKTISCPYIPKFFKKDSDG